MLSMHSPWQPVDLNSSNFVIRSTKKEEEKEKKEKKNNI